MVSLTSFAALQSALVVILLALHLTGRFVSTLCLLRHLSGMSIDIPTRTHVDYSDFVTLSYGLVKL